MRKRILSAVLLLILSFTLCCCDRVEWSNQITLSPEALKNLDIDITSGTLTIIPDAHRCSLEYTISTFGITFGRPDIRLDTTSSSTRISQRGFSVLFGSIRLDMTLYLPHDAVRSLAVEMTSGSATIDGLSLRDCTLDLTSGKVYIENVTAADFDISLTSGKVRAEEITTTDCDISLTSGNVDFAGSISRELDIDITSGDVYLRTTTLPKEINAEATSGNMKLYLPSDGGKLAYDITSGSVKCDFVEEDLPRREGNVSWGDGSCRIRVDLTSGNVSLLELD